MGVLSAQSGGSSKRSPQRPKGGKVVLSGSMQTSLAQQPPQFVHPARQTAQQKVNYAYGGGNAGAIAKQQINYRRGLLTGQQDLVVARSAQK